MGRRDKHRALALTTEPLCGGTCPTSPGVRAHLPGDNGVLVDPGFEVFVLLLEDLDPLLQEEVLLRL